MPNTNIMDGNTALARAGLLVGEAIAPGTSNLVAGNIGTGLGTFVGTSLAVAVLAPVSPLLAGLTALGLRLNSYKLATSGSNLFAGAEELIPRPASNARTIVAPVRTSPINPGIPPAGAKGSQPQA